MRPCWSADPLDALVTATAPLCNQGIHSHFYPASVYFFLTEIPSQKPGQLALSASPIPGGEVGGAVGASAAEENRAMSPAVRPWCPPGTKGLTSISPSPFWEPIFRETGGPGQGSLGVLSVASHLIHPEGRQSCARTEQGHGHVGPNPWPALCPH